MTETDGIVEWSEEEEREFQEREYDAAFGHLSRLRWTSGPYDSENYLVPCPRCGCEHLSVVRINVFGHPAESVDVIMRCHGCGERAHLGIAQRNSTRPGQTLVKVLTG